MNKGPRLRILLDVDGVLNAIDPDMPALQHIWEDITTKKVKLFQGGGLVTVHPITFVPAWGEFLGVLSRLENLEIWWLTTWGVRANSRIAPLIKCPSFPVLAEEPSRTASKVWWKQEVVQTLWESDQTPFLWIDDSFWEWPETVEWLQSLHDQPKFFHVESSLGLTLEDMSKIGQIVREFLT